MALTFVLAAAGELGGAQTYWLPDYFHPLYPGNQWVYEAQGAQASKRLHRVETISTPVIFYKGRSPVQAFTREVVRLLAAYGEENGAGQFVPDDTWLEYFLPANGWGLLGYDDDPGTMEMRLNPGLVVTNPLAARQIISAKPDVYINGAYAGVLTFSFQIVSRTNITVPAGTFSDCLHVKYTLTQSNKKQNNEEWWARGVGMVRKTRQVIRPSRTDFEEYRLLRADVVRPPVITGKPRACTNVLGSTAVFSVQAEGDGLLEYQWRKDGVDLVDSARISGVRGPILTISGVDYDQEGDYSVVVTSGYGAATSAPVTLHIQAPARFSLDNTFKGSRVAYRGAAFRTDGTILASGPVLAALRADGSVDHTFVGRGGNVLVVQADGKMLVSGNVGLLRLNRDGTLDEGFQAAVTGGDIFSVLLQPDGKILVGGDFTQVGGRGQEYLARLNPDGSLDEAFYPFVPAPVYGLAIQADSRILVGGGLGPNAEASGYLVRLEGDGTVDVNFNLATDGPVFCLALQPDGKIWIGGDFTQVGGQPRNHLARIEPDAALGDPFVPADDFSVFSLALQADGGLLVGRYSYYGSRRLFRLAPDGRVDAMVEGWPEQRLEMGDWLALAPDGAILAPRVHYSPGPPGGVITETWFGRLNNTGPATQQLSCVGSTVIWLRGGTGPELSWTTFEVTTNQSDWILLGQGTRVAGGWQMPDVSMPPCSTVRARGYVASGGNGFASGWFVEALWGFCVTSTNVSFGAKGGAGTVNVNAPGGGAWAVVNTNSWITVLSGATGTNDGVLRYSVAANPSPLFRSGNVLIGGRLLTVSQNGAEKTLPALAITDGPADKAKLTNEVVSVSGTAQDPVGVRTVQYCWANGLGTLDWAPTLGTEQWAVPALNLEIGTNTLRVRAQDQAGNWSKEIVRTFIRLARLEIMVSGCGRVVSIQGKDLVGTTYQEMGKPMTIQAVPCSGNLFADWRGGFSSNSSSLKFVMPSALSLEATFATNPFVRGNYTGLFYEDDQVRVDHSGLLSLTVTDTGHYSGYMLLKGRRYTLSGQFDAYGFAQLDRAQTTLDPLSGRLELQNPDLIRGSISSVADSGSWEASLTAVRAGPAPQKKYTLVIAATNGVSTLPGGTGYGTLSVNSAGMITFSGVLADGTKVSQAVPVSTEGHWPLYAPLYGNQGAVLGWLGFTNGASLGGDVVWMKPPLQTALYPAGFAWMTEALGSRYEPPGKGRNAWGSTNCQLSLVLGGGNLGSSVTNRFALDINNKVQHATLPYKLELKFTPSTGTFSGTQQLPGRKQPIAFSGVLLQNAANGSGFFLDTNQSGRVELRPE